MGSGSPRSKATSPHRALPVRCRPLDSMNDLLCSRRFLDPTAGWTHQGTTVKGRHERCKPHAGELTPISHQTYPQS